MLSSMFSYLCQEMSQRRRCPGGTLQHTCPVSFCWRQQQQSGYDQWSAAAAAAVAMVVGGTGTGARTGSGTEDEAGSDPRSPHSKT